MAKELGHHQRLSLDCGYCNHSRRVVGILCVVVVEQTGAVEVECSGEESSVNETSARVDENGTGFCTCMIKPKVYTVRRRMDSSSSWVSFRRMRA